MQGLKAPAICLFASIEKGHEAHHFGLRDKIAIWSPERQLRHCHGFLPHIQQRQVKRCLLTLAKSLYN
jgi:hypothetical protein